MYMFVYVGEKVGVHRKDRLDVCTQCEMDVKVVEKNKSHIAPVVLHEEKE